jgi:hypothetical protein
VLADGAMEVDFKDRKNLKRSDLSSSLLNFIPCLRQIIRICLCKLLLLLVIF